MTPEGVELTAIALPIEALVFRMLGGRQFDIAVPSLSSYVAFGGGAGIEQFTDLRWVTVRAGPRQYPI